MTLKKNLNIIGCGKLGKTIGFLLKDKITINAILNTSLNSTQEAQTFIGEGHAISDYSQLTPASLYLIGTPDRHTAEVAEQLKASGKIRPGDLVFHCAGALSVEVLQPLKDCGALIASVHPSKSFADPHKNITNFKGTICAIEGEATELLSLLFESIGARVFEIKSDAKKAYHVPCVMASNYLVTLAAMSQECYQAAGLEPDLARALTCSLMEGTLANLRDRSPAQALTGPIARCDLETLRGHMKTLAFNPELQALYAALGKYTVGLTTHDAEKKKEMLEVLTFSCQPQK